ncbi:nascent polypeptide-associated complex protein [archaeon]|nr:nascent polypeptide-associated complex protein [archaeon]
MMGGMDPRQMKAMMKQMGIKQKTIDATEVIIKTGEGELLISNPQVTEVVMQGVKTYQVMGEVSERTGKKYTEEDVKLVMEKAGCSKEKAKNALEKNDGDIATAIVNLE